jgi:hypothetical protein
MAGGVSDIYFTSLRLAKGESVAEAAATSRSRRAAATTSTSDTSTADDAGVSALSAGLDARLARFEKALSRFVWPSDASPLFNARLALRDDGLTGRLDAATVDAGTAVNPNKFFSTGKSGLAASGVDAGVYRFNVEQGSVSEDFSVTVGAHDTWRTVLGKVADAINGSENLSVRATVTRQQQPFSLDPSLAATGTVLALSVNRARLAQDVSIADTQGDLLETLDMRAAANVAAPAAQAVYETSVNRLAQPAYVHSSSFDPGAAATPDVGLHRIAVATGTGAQRTSYVSTALDPDAATTLAPGNYTFTASVGGASRELGVTVKSGWTWGSVLAAANAQLNGQPTGVWAADGQSTELVGTSGFSLPGLTSSLHAVTLPTADGKTVSARELTVTTASGFEDQSLRLADGSGGLLAALGLTTAYAGRVVSVPVAAGDTWEDVLGTVKSETALSTARVAAAAREVSVPSYAVAGTRLPTRDLVASLTLLNRRLGESMTLTDGPSGLLKSLGMNVGLPGQDGQITVNGKAQASENDAYSLQSGRVALTAQAETGSALPLAVTRSMDAVSSRLDAVVDAYNDLRKYLAANADVFSGTPAASLAQPVNANWEGLFSMGFAKIGKADLLWVSSSEFWRAFYNDADRTGQTLVGTPESLVPAWKRTVASLRAAGASSFLTPETTHLARVAVRRTAADLERTNWLVDGRV